MILILSDPANWVHNRNMIFTEIVISKFRENNENSPSCNQQQSINETYLKEV